jgi:ADP-dependent NAD(P)H-hydrate dehydratase / NAD(P)H-hydrate epimerase
VNTLVFHYLQPDVNWHNRVLFAVEEMDRRPVLIADAGFMYAAKMSGQSSQYDLFTPDIGELAFPRRFLQYLY